MLIAILNLLILLALVAAVVAIVWLTPAALRWGFNTHPALTALTLIVLFFALVIAALAAPHLFPGCGFEFVGRARTSC